LRLRKVLDAALGGGHLSMLCRLGRNG
jgi:hypothetical protein